MARSSPPSPRPEFHASCTVAPRWSATSDRPLPSLLRRSPTPVDRSDRCRAPPPADRCYRRAGRRVVPAPDPTRRTRTASRSTGTQVAEVRQGVRDRQGDRGHDVHEPVLRRAVLQRLRRRRRGRSGAWRATTSRARRSRSSRRRGAGEVLRASRRPGHRPRRTLPPALDLEVTGGLNRAQLVTWAQAFLLEVRAPHRPHADALHLSDLLDQRARRPEGAGSLPAVDGVVRNVDARRSPTSGSTPRPRTCQGIVGNVDVSKFVGTSGFPWATLSDGTVHTPWTPTAAGRRRSRPPPSSAAPRRPCTWKPGDAGTAG